MMVFQCHVSFQGTLPKTNTSIAPEKMASQKQSSLPSIDDQKLAVSFRECKLVQSVGVFMPFCWSLRTINKAQPFFVKGRHSPPFRCRTVTSPVVVFRGFLAWTQWKSSPPVWGFFGRVTGTSTRVHWLPTKQAICWWFGYLNAKMYLETWG